MKTYGMPFLGSKNAIAKKIIDFLPAGSCFVDLFGGGGAITHCAALSGKYEKIIYNEKNRGVCFLFFETCHYHPHFLPFCSREDFFNTNDIKKRIVFSYAHNYWSYFCSKEKEKEQRLLYEKESKESPPFVCQKRFFYVFNDLNGKNITFSNESFEDVRLPENSVVYCDPPYKNTTKYYFNKEPFDHEFFWNWARACPHLVFVSEYEAPPDFIPVAIFKRTVPMPQSKQTTKENLFIHESKIEPFKQTQLF